MTKTNLQISMETYNRLEEMADATGVSIEAIVEQAVDVYRMQSILSATNVAYAALRENAKVWRELETERELCDVTIDDGLKNLLPGWQRPLQCLD